MKKSPAGKRKKIVNRDGKIELLSCSDVGVDAAEHYNQSYVAIKVARDLMMAAMIVGTPIIIISSFGLCASFTFG